MTSLNTRFPHLYLVTQDVEKLYGRYLTRAVVAAGGTASALHVVYAYADQDKELVYDHERLKVEYLGPNKLEDVEAAALLKIDVGVLLCWSEGEDHET